MKENLPYYNEEESAERSYSGRQSNHSSFVKNRVSIVTPVYNGEKHISRFLNSILGQTWDKIELILVDDGSEDHTVQTAETFRTKFENRGYDYYVITADHKNASAAINHGLPFVTGEFLIWPDSDDVLKNTSIQKRVEFLLKNPQYQCVRSLSCYVDEQTGVRTSADEKRGDLKEEHLFFPILESKTFVCCGCYMLRTKPFFEIYPNRKIPEYDVGQNFQMLLPFMYFHSCALIQEELYVVYKRQESHSRRILTQKQEFKKYADYEKMIDELAAICCIRDKKELQRIRCWKQLRRFQIYTKYNKKKKAFRALICTYRLHGMAFHKFLMHVIWLFGRPVLQKMHSILCIIRKY